MYEVWAWYFQKAVSELYPHAEIHRASHLKGYYCRIEHLNEPLYNRHCEPDKGKMREIISRNEPIICEEQQTEHVKKLFRTARITHPKIHAVEVWATRIFAISELETSSITTPASCFPQPDIWISLIWYLSRQQLLRFPIGIIPTSWRYGSAAQNVRNFQGIPGLEPHHGSEIGGEFNRACQNNQAFNLIKIAEALHEKKSGIGCRYDTGTTNGEGSDDIRASSSGKNHLRQTTFHPADGERIKAKTISLDNYFVDREHTPRDENGRLGFWSTLVLWTFHFFNQQLSQLMNGEEIALHPIVLRMENGIQGEKLRLEEDTIPDHGRNTCAQSGTYSIHFHRMPFSKSMYQPLLPFPSMSTTGYPLPTPVYFGVLYAGLSLPRLFGTRYQYRAGRVCDVAKKKWIFPYQENADVMFNSAWYLNWRCWKDTWNRYWNRYPNIVMNTETPRLMKFLRYFTAIPDREIPPASLLREFVGGAASDINDSLIWITWKCMNLNRNASY